LSIVSFSVPAPTYFHHQIGTIGTAHAKSLIFFANFDILSSINLIPVDDHIAVHTKKNIKQIQSIYTTMSAKLFFAQVKSRFSTPSTFIEELYFPSCSCDSNEVELSENSKLPTFTHIIHLITIIITNNNDNAHTIKTGLKINFNIFHTLNVHHHILSRNLISKTLDNITNGIIGIIIHNAINLKKLNINRNNIIKVYSTVNTNSNQTSKNISHRVT
jgi:hypothetical protein